MRLRDSPAVATVAMMVDPSYEARGNPLAWAPSDAPRASVADCARRSDAATVTASRVPINQIALSDGRSASPCEITNAWTNNAIRVGAVQPRVGPFASALGTLARNAPIPSR